VSAPTLITILAFCAGLLAVEALYWLVFKSRGARKAINRRLALSQEVHNQPEVLDILRRERGFADFQSTTLTGLNDYIVQTGLRISRGSLALSTLAIGLAIAALGSFFIGPPWIAVLAGLIGAPLIVLLFLKITRDRRIERFGLQLPDAIDVFVRGLRVGHPLSKALEIVSREMSDPIGTECGITADEMTFGQDFTTAINNLYRRVGQEDLMFLVVAISVQSQTGGNLAEVLTRLSKLIRGRSLLTMKVKALSAEGRMSARFLTAMPFVLYGAVQFMSPDFYNEVWGQPIAVPAIGYGLISLLIANYTIYRMVNFKV
jgi:tight adherence protein B